MPRQNPMSKVKQPNHILSNSKIGTYGIMSNNILTDKKENLLQSKGNDQSIVMNNITKIIKMTKKKFKTEKYAT